MAGHLMLVWPARVDTVNGQVEVPVCGQLNVPAPRGWFSWFSGVHLLVLGLVSSGRSRRR